MQSHSPENWIYFESNWEVSILKLVFTNLEISLSLRVVFFSNLPSRTQISFVKMQIHSPENWIYFESNRAVSILKLVFTNLEISLSLRAVFFSNLSSRTRISFVKMQIHSPENWIYFESNRAVYILKLVFTNLEISLSLRVVFFSNLPSITRISCMSQCRFTHQKTEYILNQTEQSLILNKYLLI